MKNLTSRVVVLMVLALCAVGAQAQLRTMLYADIPFSFNIGDKHFESGRYTIAANSNEIESWTDANGKAVAMFTTIPKETMGDDNNPRLVFYRNGDRYSLAQVWGEYSAHEVRGSSKAAKLAKAGEFQTVALLKKPAR
jgi:hypothetical protein